MRQYFAALFTTIVIEDVLAQYLGFALSNRTALLPSREMLDRARRVAAGAKERLTGKMEILFVLPDYHSDFPKACMSGWGRQFLNISPTGKVLRRDVLSSLASCPATSL